MPEKTMLLPPTEGQIRKFQEKLGRELSDEIAKLPEIGVKYPSSLTGWQPEADRELMQCILASDSLSNRFREFDIVHKIVKDFHSLRAYVSEATKGNIKVAVAEFDRLELFRFAGGSTWWGWKDVCRMIGPDQIRSVEAAYLEYRNVAIRDVVGAEKIGDAERQAITNLFPFREIRWEFYLSDEFLGSSVFRKS